MLAVLRIAVVFRSVEEAMKMLRAVLAGILGALAMSLGMFLMRGAWAAFARYGIPKHAVCLHSPDTRWENGQTRLYIQSVSRPSVAANSLIRTGPAIASGHFRASLVYTSTSFRASTGRWSFGPAGVGVPQQLLPPTVGEDHQDRTCTGRSGRGSQNHAQVSKASCATSMTGSPASPLRRVPPDRAVD